MSPRMPVPRSKPKFQPVVLIPDAELTDLDRLAIRRTYATYDFVKTVMDTARSKQTKVGVSEFGDPCRKCLARKLGGVEQVKDPNWKAQIGTFGHAGLEQHYLDHYPEMYDVEYRENPDAPGGWERVITVKPDLVATDERPLYHLERTVSVGTIDRHGFDLTGSCDLFEEGATYGIVRDWKFQGKSSLEKSARGNIGPKYHTQMNGYGRGYQRAGKLVTHVQLWAWPRDDEIEAARPVLMRYDEQMAVDALERMGQLMDAADLLGWEAVIEHQPQASGCWDCKRFNDAADRNFVDMMTGR